MKYFVTIILLLLTLVLPVHILLSLTPEIVKLFIKSSFAEFINLSKDLIKFMKRVIKLPDIRMIAGHIVTAL